MFPLKELQMETMIILVKKMVFVMNFNGNVPIADGCLFIQSLEIIISELRTKNLNDRI